MIWLYHNETFSLETNISIGRYDRWFRTPVHWAVLNQRIDALGVLLYHGASASPAKPKSGVSKRSTNVIIETPLEMCSRLYGDSDIGKQISSMLDNAS